MTERQDLDRAMTLAEMAPNSTVTFGVLADRESGYAGSRVSDPPVTYLEDTEAPAYVLTNEKRGVGVGAKRNTTRPSSDRGTVVVVTGRRTLCVVGRADEDEVIEVPHDSVAEVSYHTGLLGHRIALKTPLRQYHCWVSRKTDETVLAAATEYVRERKPEAPFEGEDAESDPNLEGQTLDGEAQFRYRGQPVTREQHPGLPDEPPESAGSGGDGDATEVSSAGQGDENGATGEPQFSYRGRPVTREQHPGLPDDPSTGGTGVPDADSGDDTGESGDVTVESAGEVHEGGETDDENGEISGRDGSPSAPESEAVAKNGL